jgi:hypothetical protein
LAEGKENHGWDKEKRDPWRGSEKKSMEEMGSSWIGAS